MTWKQLIDKIKQFFYIPPVKPLTENTDEELIAEYKKLYDSVVVMSVGKPSLSDTMRINNIGYELSKRGYDINQGACSVTITKRQ